jgi:hypothetical protein
MCRLVLAAFSIVTLVAAPGAFPCDCGGCPPSSCGTTAVAPPGSGLLLVRNSGQSGPAEAFDVSTGRHRFSLPAGVVSANGRRFFSSLRERGTIVIRAYDGRRGRLLHAWRQPGWHVAGTSGNGGLVALTRFSPRPRLTQFRLESGAGRTVAQIALHGDFGIDGIANDGRRLFLIQYGQTGYLVRSYDLDRRALEARPLTEKGVPMQGTAWDAVASADGRFLLTLFLRGNGDAEVHTLDLARGTAVCIDLPSGDPVDVQQYALALARNGRTLYAANPALGVVARIDLRTRRVVRVVRFARDFRSGVQSSTGAISRDGRTVYFTAGSRLYAFDAAYGRVRGPYRAGGTVAGVAFSKDGRHLLVVRSDGRRAIRLSAATGRKESP